MKISFCVFGVLLATVAVKCGVLDEFKKVTDECKAELKIDNLDELIGNPPIFDKPELSCFNACSMKKLGEMVDGKLVYEKVLELVVKHWNMTDEQSAGLPGCVNEANELTNECEVAGAMLKCAFGHLKLTPLI